MRCAETLGDQRGGAAGRSSDDPAAVSVTRVCSHGVSQLLGPQACSAAASELSSALRLRSQFSSPGSEQWGVSVPPYMAISI